MGWPPFLSVSRDMHQTPVRGVRVSIKDPRLFLEVSRLRPAAPEQMATVGAAENGRKLLCVSRRPDAQSAGVPALRPQPPAVAAIAQSGAPSDPLSRSPFLRGRVRIPPAIKWPVAEQGRPAPARPGPRGKHRQSTDCPPQ